MVKMGQLFAQDEVFQQRRAAQAKLERVLVVGNCHALVGGEHLACRINAHLVERGYGGVDAFGCHAAGFVRAVGFRNRAGAGQTRLGLNGGTRLGRHGVFKAMLGGLGRVERHGG